MKYDQLLVHVGEFGPAQKRICAWFVLFYLLASWEVLVPVFTLYQPAHRCQLPDFPNDTYAAQNDRHLFLINQTIPRDDEGKFSSCLVYTTRDQHNDTKFSSNNDTEERETRQCEKWVFDRSVMTSTLSEELSIVCQNSVMRANQYLVSSLSRLAATILVGYLGDRFGRKVTFMMSLVLKVVSMFGNAFVWDWTSMLVLRFLVIASSAGTDIILYVLCMEFMGTTKRTLPSTLSSIAWTASQIHLTLVAYLTRDWQHLILALTSPCLVFFAFYWILPESPRWLLTQGRNKEACVIIQKMAKVNKVDLDPAILEEVTLEKEKSESVLVLFRTRLFRVRYAILILAWNAVTALYYGLTYNVSNLSGDLYLNFFLSELVEIGGCISSFLLLDRMGRRLYLSGTMLGSGLACLACVLPAVLNHGSTAAEVSTLILSNTGKLLVSGAFCAVYIYTLELTPTVCRSGGTALCSAICRLGGILASYLADLSLYISGPVGRMLPPLIFGVLGLVSGGLILLLPETMNCRLPETVQDALHMERGPVTNVMDVSAPLQADDKDSGNSVI